MCSYGVVDAGGRTLQRISRSGKNLVRLRRAIMVMMSGWGRTVQASPRCCRSAITTCECGPHVHVIEGWTRGTPTEGPT